MPATLLLVAPQRRAAHSSPGEVTGVFLVNIQINHAIVAAHDPAQASRFVADLFGLPEPMTWGPFHTVLLGDGAHLHYAHLPGITEIQFQHYAFRVSEVQFDEIYARLRGQHLEHWADPQMNTPGQFNTNHGGRGVYFRDLSGHFLEVLTKSEVE